MKRNLFFMYAISFFQGMVFYASIATLYRRAAGLNVFQITLIESISMALTLLFEIPWGVVADRIGYRRTMISCGILYFISKIIFWRAQDFAGFLCERVLLAIVCAGLSGVDTSILYLSCEKKESQHVFGIYNGLGSVGLLAAAAVYSVFIGDNYRMAGFLTVISYGIAAALGFGIKETRTPKGRETVSLKASTDILKNTFQNRRLLMLILAAAFLGEVNQTITVFFNQLQYTKAGMPDSVISGMYILVTLSGTAGMLSASLTKWLKPRLFGALLFTIGGFSCLVLAFTENPVLSVLGVLWIRVSFSLMSPLQTKLQNELLVTEDRATALSMNALVMDLMAVFTNLIFGKLADYRLSAAMCFGGILCAFGMILYLMSRKCS